jgi:Sec-independent protein translocase protein TatA
VLDLSLNKLVVLVVIAAVVFGSALLPKVVSQASRALRELRRR